LSWALCHVRLVFGGGSALSRAHRLIRRMSEDIDLRIVVDSNRPGRGTLRRFRAKVTEALLGAGFKFDPEGPARRGLALRERDNRALEMRRAVTSPS
jgi:predicted nucleotidyltransferase component of viral defense system